MVSLWFRNLSLSLGALCLMGASAQAFAQTSGVHLTDFDDQSAVIFTYFAVGNDDTPSASITKEQFADQIAEIAQKPYTVKPLPEIIDAFRSGKPLPPRTVAITFDGADQTIFNNAIPLLEKNNLPYTIFVPADRVSSGKPPYMTWDNLRSLKRSSLASFGIHPASYGRLAGSPAEEIRRQINNSLSKVREELGVEAPYLAYPFGDYSNLYKKIASEAGLKAAFGQQSGAAYAGDDRFALPRFTLTERYGDMDRFRMTAGAMPLPVTDISPADSQLDTLNPAIGFTLPEPVSKNMKNSLSCFLSGGGRPKLEFIGPNRVELRLQTALLEDRPRLNCTLPVVASSSDEELPRWRWFGVLYSLKPGLLEESAPADGDVTANANNGGGLE